MRTHDHGFETGKGKKLSRKKNKNIKALRRHIDEMSDEHIARLMEESANHFSQPHVDETGRAIFRSMQNQLGGSRVQIQAKLEISHPEDHSEKQADDLAQSVIRGSSEQSQEILSKPTNEVSRMSEGGEGGMQTSGEFDQKLQSTKGQGQKLDEGTKSELEEHTGTDLSGVNIHTSGQAHNMNEDINAKAFTHGQDIYFKQGNYNPDSKDGKELLAHEVTHTVQQGEGVQMKIQRQAQTDGVSLEDLKDELESTDVDETKVLEMLGKLDPAQKTYVLIESHGYLQLMANSLSADTEMKEAMKILGADLTKTLKWLLKADEASMFDDLSDDTVMNLIDAASASELAELGKHADVLSSLKEETGDIIYSAITKKIQDATEQVTPPKEDLTKAKTHRTVAGDTYGKLAKTYNVTVDNLRAWNIYPDTKIPIGVDLYVSDPSKEMALEVEAWQRSFGEYLYWQLRKQKGKNFQMTDAELIKYLGAYAEYLPTLKSIIACQSWIDQRDTKVGALYESMLGDNIGKLTPAQVVAIQDARIQSVKDIQVDYWIALMPVAFAWLPLAYGEPMTPLKSNTLKINVTGSVINAAIGFGTGDEEIITYKAAKEITKGAGGAIQGHHLIEQRFLKYFGMDLEAAPTVILSRTEHTAMTNVLRNLMPYGAAPLTKQQIINFYRIAYKQYPNWIKAIENYWK